MATLLNNIAATLKNLGRLKESLDYHRSAYEMRVTLMPYENQDILNSVSNIASILYDLE